LRVLVGDQDSSGIHVVADLVHDKAVQADKKLIPGVGHTMNLERPDTLNQAVLDFLS
jgi:3-oxoadipate enol-lactonase